MKTIAIMLALTIAGGTVTYAQCGKKFTITTSKTDHLDSKGTLTHSDDEKAVVVIGQKDISIKVSNSEGDHAMAGTIKSDSCSWPVAYKEGKSSIKAVLTREDGQEINVTITIEGKDGKVTLFFEAENEPDDKIRVAADKFEETT